MSFRFAIIKVVKTLIGDGYEDVVFEYKEEKLVRKLKQYFVDYLPFKRTRFGEPKYTEEEIINAFDKAWTETVEEFKEVTVRIF